MPSSFSASTESTVSYIRFFRETRSGGSSASGSGAGLVGGGGGVGSGEVRITGNSAVSCFFRGFFFLCFFSGLGSRVVISSSGSGSGAGSGGGTGSGSGSGMGSGAGSGAGWGTGASSVWAG